MNRYTILKVLCFIFSLLFAISFLVTAKAATQFAQYVIGTIIFLAPSILLIKIGLWASNKENTYKTNSETKNIKHLEKSTKKSLDNRSNLNSSSNPLFSIETTRSTETTVSGPPSDPEDLKLLTELGKTQLLNWCDGKSYPVDYPSYFSYDYFINNADEIHKGWIDSGILALPKIDEILKYKTVVELKEILRKNNLKVSGKKSELIDRIIENNAFSVDFQNENNDPIYAITEAGRAILKNNKPWLYYHRMKNSDIIPLKFYKETWEQLQNAWKFVPSGLDISWACLQELKLGVKSYRDLRSVLLASIENLEYSKKEEIIPDLALQIICIDLSGGVPFIAPYLINKVREIPKEELETRFYKAYDQIKVYEHFNVAGSLATKNEIFKFILLGLDDIEKCNKELEKNYN